MSLVPVYFSVNLNSNMDRIQSAVLQQSNSHASGVSFCLPYTYIIKNLSLFCFQAVKIPINPKISFFVDLPVNLHNQGSTNIYKDSFFGAYINHAGMYQFFLSIGIKSVAIQITAPVPILVFSCSAPAKGSSSSAFFSIGASTEKFFTASLGDALF